MEKQQSCIKLTLILSIIILSNCYNLGPNIITNSNFQNPAIDTAITLNQFIPDLIPGWTCVNFCTITSVPYLCQFINSSYCSLTANNQMMNLQSIGLENATQIFNITKNSTYLLSFQWLPPAFNASKKSLALAVNGVIIETISMNVSDLQTTKLHNYSEQINLKEGSNRVRFVGLGYFDGYGTYIDNVFLQQIIIINNSTNTTNNTNSNNTSTNTNTINTNSSMMEVSSIILQGIMNNSVTSTLNRLVGSRVFFSYLTAYNVNLDRLQFYYYHRQNFTHYATMFLQAITFFKQQQGSLLQLVFQQSSKDSFKKIAQTEVNLQQVLNFKANFTNEYFNQKNSNGYSFVTNQFSFFYYQLTSLLVIHFVLWLVFQFTKEYRISIYFRKYCFLATIFFLVYEGNLEEFSFYFIAQCRFYVSLNITHKLVNIFIIAFGFGIYFFVFGAFILFYGHYGKQIKYLLEDYRFQILSFISASLDSGVAPLASAIIHSFFLQNLLMLSICLVLLESSWILTRIYFLCKGIYLSKGRLLINITCSMLRIVFLITLYAYQIGASQLMNQIHLYFMISYLVLWLLDLMLVFFAFISGLINFIKKVCLNNKVANKPKTKRQISKRSQQQLPKINIFIEEINNNGNKQHKQIFNLNYKKKQGQPVKKSNLKNTNIQIHSNDNSPTPKNIKNKDAQRHKRVMTVKFQ